MPQRTDAQEAPDAPPRKPMSWDPEPVEGEWTASEPVRLVNVMGISGTRHPERDIAFAIGFGTRKGWRVHRYLTLGVRNQVLLRNWSEVSRYYGYIVDCEKIDARCDRRANYWSVGWLIALASADAGWEVALRAEGPQQPWVSAGTSLMLYQDGTGFGEDGASNWIVAHAGTLGAGYDFGVLGVGAHLSYANDSIFLASSGARVFSFVVSLEILLPREHGDHRRRRASVR